MNYKHTQIGYLIIYVLIVIALLFVVILTQTGMNSLILVFMFFILFVVGSFTTLNVLVDKNYLRIKFGYGIFRKRFTLKEIISAKIVKNHWYYGWGIRLWFWPYMWIFNVSGFDAVEIRMKNNKIYRIGTDEPKKLERVISQVIK
tara:strand:+ start:29 stop:463 length:435 start_codon:yes stop_codon:yes gene_type:complete